MRVATRRAGIIGSVLGCLLVGVAAPPGSGAERHSGAVEAVTTAATASVVVSEITNGGPGGASDAFFELRNDGDEPVSLTGWALYRCDEAGLRAPRTAPEIDLTDVVLTPGGVLTVGWSGGARAAEASFARPLSSTGFGLILLDPSGATADAVAVYPDAPATTQSECGEESNLPVALAWALDESWQRASSGWVRARATPGSPRLGAPTVALDAAVRIEEVAAAGPAGHGDDVIELRNTTGSEQPLTGWRLYRCTAAGVADAASLQHVFGAGDTLAAGARLVIGGPGFSDDADVRTDTSLADLVSGVLLVDADGRRVDGVSVSSLGDTACQRGHDKLPATLDYRTGESWQRTTAGGWVVGPRTPGDANIEQSSAIDRVSSGGTASVVVTEIAADPEVPGQRRRNLVELGNVGDDAVDISGWRVIACGRDGFRRFDDLATVPAGTVLDAGDAWLLTLAGTPDAGAADATFPEALEMAGAGVWVEDAVGRRRDGVGIYHRNEMDGSVDRESPCTNGLALPTFGVDRLRGETYQRTASTGDDTRDFRAAPASPGVLTHLAPVDVGLLAAGAGRGDGDVTGYTAVLTAGSARVDGVADVGDAAIEWAYTGASAAPLSSRRGVDETAWSVEGPPAASDDGYALPYLRFGVRAEASDPLTWTGRTTGRTALRLSVWSPARAAWRELDSGTGTGAGDAAVVTLTGALRGGETPDGVAEILVQVVPSDPSAMTDASGLADPADYDLAISHLSDTQYYTEAYPEVYAAQVGWIAANSAAGRIAFSVHTGDLVQNWVDPDQREERARREYETASQMQAVLDDAGVANSVLPGNHDNKRGVTNELFNEFFPPSRYRGERWYGGSIAPGDNSANWSRFSAAGADFVVVSLPYAYGEDEVVWAEDVVRAHPDANVIIATHEHLTPHGGGVDAERSTTSRWVSHGDLLWERVVAPHRNVFLVLSGHFHGVGTIVTEDAGGIAGHTVVEALADYQEFRTHTGERATGFQRLLQLDLAGGALAVDTLSVPLEASASHPYDYGQFVADDGDPAVLSNERPWNVVAAGVQGRYTAEDDAFAVDVALQHEKTVATQSVTVDHGTRDEDADQPRTSAQVSTRFPRSPR